MNRWTLLLFLFLSIGTSLGQSPKIDTLKIKLSIAKHDSTRAKILMTLAKNYRNVDKDSMLLFAKQALYKTYGVGTLKWMGEAHLRMARSYHSRHDNDSIIFHTDKADSIYSILKNPRKQLDAGFLEGLVLYTANQRHETIVHFTELLRLVYDHQLEERVPNRIAQIHQILGTQYENIGKPILGLEHHFECLRISEERKTLITQIGSHNNIGIIYQNMLNNEMAMQHYNKALVLLDSVNHPDIELGVVTNSGMIKLKVGDIPGAMVNFKKAESIAKTIGEKCRIAFIYESIANCFIEMKQYDSANLYINNAIQTAIKCKSDLFQTSAHYTNGKLKRLEGNHQAAKESFAKSLELAKKINEYKYISKSSLALYEIERSIKNESKALHYLTEYLHANDSVMNRENVARLSYLEAKFHFEKKKEVIESENKMREVKLQEEVIKERLIGIAVSVILLIIIGTGLVLYRTKVKSNRLLKEKNDLIQKQNIKIADAAETEKLLLQTQIQSRDRELASFAMQFNERNNTLKKLEDKISLLAEKSDNNQGDLKNIKKMIQSNLDHQEEAWNTFMSKFEEVYPQFFENIKSSFESLTLNQLKICAYLKVGMDNRDIANVSHIEMDSVKKNIFRMKKKMNIGPEGSIRDFLISYN